ncbi:MAG TPA: hypothetical protein ENI38_03920, partial [Candidatus Acetothermia bacterium]|nr:hypothetical protein [Candidatus Acetothermia bacterium]
MRAKLVLLLGITGIVAWGAELPSGAGFRLGQGIVLQVTASEEGIWVASAWGLELWAWETAELRWMMEITSPEPRVAAILP